MTAPLVLASRWANPDNRRREALRAAHAQDAEILCDLLEYHLRLKSRKAGTVSDATLRSYSLAVRDFLGYCGPADAPRHALNQMTPEIIEQYVIALHTRKLALTSVRTYLYGVRALFRALAWSGAIKDDPARDVKAPYDPTPAHTRKRAIPLDRVRALLELPHERCEDENVALRDEVLLAMGVTLGLRASEIVGLDVGDVELGVRELHVRSGKGGKARRVPLTRGVVDLLGRWLRHRDGLRLRGDIADNSSALLVSFSRASLGRRLSVRGLREIVNTYLAAAGLPKDMFGVHTLRRTAGTRLYRATRDLHVVSDILGHASVTTSAIYAKMDADIRREALEKIEDDL